MFESELEDIKTCKRLFCNCPQTRWAVSGPENGKMYEQIAPCFIDSESLDPHSYHHLSDDCEIIYPQKCKSKAVLKRDHQSYCPTVTIERRNEYMIGLGKT